MRYTALSLYNVIPTYKYTIAVYIILYIFLRSISVCLQTNRLLLKYNRIRFLESFEAPETNFELRVCHEFSVL